MGRRQPRFNAKARASSHLVKNAKAHPKARDGGLEALVRKRKRAGDGGTLGGQDGLQSSKKGRSAPSDSDSDDGERHEVPLELEGLVEEDEYRGSSGSAPLVLVPGQKGPKGPEAEPPRPAGMGKMSSKKRKRFEKFVKRQEAKKEHNQIMAKLSEISEKSKSVQPLLLSSKLLGRPNALRDRIDPAAEAQNGVREAPNGSGTNEVEMDSDFDEDSDLERDLRADSDGGDEESRGALPPAQFGSALKSANPAFGSSLKPKDGTMAPSGPGFGSALKPKGAPLAASAEPRPPPAAEVDAFDAAVAEQRQREEEAFLEEKARKRQEQRKRQKEARRRAREAQGKRPDGSDSDSDSLDWRPPPKTPAAPVLTADPKQVTPANLQTSKYIQHVPRTEAMSLARQELPIMQYESNILDAVLHNPVTIICGSTGSGKTTQVPQILYEFGFGNPDHPLFSGGITVTEPRRVAAIGVARRVTEEMGEVGKKVVGYQVRYDKSEGIGDARIKFVTDGILLRELSGAANEEQGGGDLLLKQYSCIILDEAHERTIGTDVLIGWLSRIVKLRNSEQARRSGVKPLRLVIMSATLRVQDVAGNRTLFESVPPVVNVEGRQYKVVVHFQRVTPTGPGAYVKEAFRKLCKIHERLPPGGVLVFLTGRAEIDELVRLLREKYPKKRILDREREALEEQEAGDRVKGGEGFVVQDDADLEDDGQLDAELGRADADADDGGASDSGGEDGNDSEEEVAVLEGEEDEESQDAADPTLQEALRTPSSTPREQIQPLHILPLHSLLPNAAQMRIFKDVPEGHRLVVVATNIAETSLTIPGIRYVLDSGKVKSRDYDPRTGVQRFVTGWTSRASADQRAGRAGRVGVGHCYRLFSSAVFGDKFREWTEPEIARVPLEGVVLQMKSMGIAQVANFPYPTPPDRDRLRAAEKLLTYLGAIDPSSSSLSATAVGRIMGKLPVSPRYSKMIVLAAQQPPENNVLAHVIALVAGMSVPGEVFVRPSDVLSGADVADPEDDEGEGPSKEERKHRHGKFWRAMAMFAGPDAGSDHLRVLGAIGAYEHHRRSHLSESALERFCRDHFLNPKSMAEVAKLRGQLTSLARTVLAPYAAASANVQANLAALAGDRRLPPPDAKQRSALCQLVFAGFPDQLARLSPLPNSRQPNYATLESQPGAVVRIHASSVLHPLRPPADWIVYTESSARDELLGADGETLLDARGGLKDPSAADSQVLKTCTVVKEAWIPALAPKSLCAMHPILDDPPPAYDPASDAVLCRARATYAGKWPLPSPLRVPFPTGPDAPPGTGTTERSRRFALALLDGLVFSPPGGGRTDPFALLVPKLVQPARTLVSDAGKHLPRCADLVSALARRGIASRAALLDAWRGEPGFLRKEAAAWYSEPERGHVVARWPPVKPKEGGGWAADAGLMGLLGAGSKAGSKAKGRKQGWKVEEVARAADPPTDSDSD
ncbi:P-loop containing nucleoside triphosphate hydrolase protein [Hyaloraphidium curvatum]|nr:P-loop containing nucleoside triphosphate hydrolase protein [Hyaloraphidium curvatum]